MLDYCPKRGKQNSHRARAARNKNPRTNRQTQDAKRPTGDTNHRATRRYNLAYTRLHDLVAKASSKSHSAFLRPLGSRFTGTSATYPNGLPRLTVPPRAFNVSGALPATRILTAKFASQSMDRLQAPQLNTHSLRGSLAFATPQHAPTRPYSTILFPPVPVAGVEPARPTGHPLLRRACLPFHHTGKRKRERKQTRATTTRPQCAQPAGHTHTSRTIGQPNPRARTLSTGPPRPAQLTHQHREHPGANTQAPPAHTQRTTNAATHPSVTAPAAASIHVLFPLPGRRSRT